MEESQKGNEAGTGGSVAGWVVSFVLFPYGPFVYLARLKVITAWSAALLVFASAVFVVGTVSVLAETNEEPWQQWVVTILGAGLYLLGTLQYAAGARKGFWGPNALRSWRTAGWFFGMLLLLALLADVAMFHLGSAGLIPK